MSFHIRNVQVVAAVMLQSMTSLSVKMQGLSMCSCLQIKSWICLALQSEAMIPLQPAFQALLVVLLRQLFTISSIGGVQRQLMSACIACLGALHTPGSELQKTKVSSFLCCKVTDNEAVAGSFTVRQNAGMGSSIP